MTTDRILDKAVRREPLTRDEAYALYECTPVQELAAAADAVRRATVADPTVVTWQIDRNVNITNVCISGCKFLQFPLQAPRYASAPSSPRARSTAKRSTQTLALGGDQLLLQGGLHPQLGIDFYEELFRDLKRMLPPDPASCARCARSGPHRPHQRSDDARNAAPAHGRRTGFAAGRRSRNPRPRRAARDLARQALGGVVARGDARSPLRWGWPRRPR